MRWGCRTKGQVSIFLVLLFQVLFVFFAMVVNVGLLVYYKINLQNSVDLAAYYGAMKQAEMLNTIGHINYQIRQSWKLLAYRNTILGTLGPTSHVGRPGHAHQSDVGPQPPEVSYGMAQSPPNPKFPVYCITISEIYGNVMNPVTFALNTLDNQCLTDTNYNLSGFRIPPVIWGLVSTNQTIRQGAIKLQEQFLDEFGQGGLRNYRTLMAIIVLFRADSLNRRKVIGVLANSMSKDESDFTDLDNASVRAGSQKVLEKNLAEENKSNLAMKMYNSMANPNCGGANTDIESLPGWLKEIELEVFFPYSDSIVNDAVFDGPGKASQEVRHMGLPNGLSLPYLIQTRASSAPQRQSLLPLDELLIRNGILQHPAGRWTTAVGVEKNPWCVPYVGIKATSKPKLPFMPTGVGNFELKAQAFAKPFGGHIGPWYGKLWSDRSITGSSDRDVNNSIDGRMPPRVFDGQGSSNNPSLQQILRSFANFARFPGDQLGLLSEAVRWAYAKYYWGPGKTDNAYHTTMWYMPIQEANDVNFSPGSPFFMGPPNGDILAEAYNPQYFKSNPVDGMRFARDMRKTEMQAIAPDIFDITYYSIEPRFNKFYLPRLKTFIQQNNSKRPNLMVRGDLGWREANVAGNDGLSDPGVNVETHVQQFAAGDFYRQTPQVIFHNISNIDQLLTSWAEKSIIDYDPANSAEKVGKCSARIPPDGDTWNPGACVKGGRTGYSVKLVSKKFLSNNIPDIGGQGVSGLILNPPDANF